MSEDTQLREIVNSQQFKDRFKVDTKHCLTQVNKQWVSDKEIVLTVHLFTLRKSSKIE